MMGLAAPPTGCDFDNMLAKHSNDDGVIGKMAKSMTEAPKGMYKWPDGTFRSVAPPDVLIAEVRRERCFQTDAYSVGDRGLRAVTDQPQRDEISLSRYLALGDAAARRVAKAPSFELDDAIVAYFKSRKT